MDGEERAQNGATMVVGTEVRAVCALSDDRPLAFAVGAVAAIRLPGTLPPGEHTIEISVNTRETGPLVFPVIDSVT